MSISRCMGILEAASVQFEPGLSARELRKIEEKFAFLFPPDHRDLLMSRMPVSKGFVNWRKDSEKDIRKKLIWPYEGICFDIMNSSFWRKEWGEKPIVPEDACRLLKTIISKAPTLIPIYGHRYIPDRPHERGNPVFSVYQTDIICYGSDLCNYFENEFGPKEKRNLPTITPKRIEFWSSLV
ncbi:MAG: SMI1/KNR4 family protein [Chloroflexi bacterium]|nr:SMI1/KNR4 family protein [Chloroflexota bacterium]